MRMNTRGRYGIQLMTQLACRVTDPRPVGLKEIARVTGLPWRYLEQIAGSLRKASLIAGRPGRAGGHRLGRSPDLITLREVLETTTGSLSLMDCVDTPSVCDHSQTCASRHIWVTVTQELRDVLDRYTLSDLAMRPCAGCRAAAAKARDTRTPARPSRRGSSTSRRRKDIRSNE